MNFSTQENRLKKVLFFAIGVGTACWGGLKPAAAFPLHPQAETLEASQVAAEKNSEKNSEKTSDEANDAEAEEKETPEFVRVFKDGKKPQALQTAVAKYRKVGQTDGPEVTLIGAVHIADPTYYSRLNQLFRSYDALLYELVSDPDAGVPDPEERGLSPVSTIQVGMKDALEMTFQLDEIDYRAKNFVHADMTPTEFFKSLNKRQEGVFQMMLRSIGAGIAMQGQTGGSDLDLLAALVSEDRTPKLRRAFAKQMQMMDGQMAAITGEDGKSTLITERNAKAFEVLDRELKAGKEKLGVFYGAGHLKDMHERLLKDFGMELVETEWLDAWDLK